MPALPFLRFLALILLIAIPFTHAAAASVGTVTRVQNQAQVGSKTATVGTPINMNDVLRTGASARLQVTFHDGTSLTLGENARVVVDRYVYKPDKGKGEMALQATRGALHLVTGRLGQMREKNVKVTTPAAALAVRGTEFWTGPIDGHDGALLLKGKVEVRNRAGAVVLHTPGQGTDIRSRRRR